MAEEMKNKNIPTQEDNKDGQIPKDFQAIIAGIFPNTKYFDSRFDLLQVQIDELRRNQEIIREDLKDFKKDVEYRFLLVDKRFEQVDKRFEQVDKRFEQIDKRFEQVNKRFEQVIASIDRLADKLDYRDRDQRNFTLRMFSISIAISILGVLGAFLKIVGVF
ncbi:hypothetical protein [Desulfonauticus submarinus]